jgi:hypothetical protein
MGLAVVGYYNGNYDELISEIKAEASTSQTETENNTSKPETEPWHYQVEEVPQIENTPPPPPTDPMARLLGIDSTIVEYATQTQSACDASPFSSSNAFYCSADDTIYVSNYVRGLPRVIQMFILAHEYGHSKDPNILISSTFTKEQYADRYGGMKVCQLYRQGYVSDSELSTVRSWILTLGDPTHGTGRQRLAAFDVGCA